MLDDPSCAVNRRLVAQNRNFRTVAETVNGAFTSAAKAVEVGCGFGMAEAMAFPKLALPKSLRSFAPLGRARRPSSITSRGQECPRYTKLAAAAGAAAASASVAASVAGHDGAAEGAGGGVAEVDDSGEGVGGVVAAYSWRRSGRGRPGSTDFRRAVYVSYRFCYRCRGWPQAQVLE